MRVNEDRYGQQFVALRKESVDRNTSCLLFRPVVGLSLSARRAWIEMPDSTHRREPFPSLSARRAWIEISCADSVSYQHLVALRKESVDRNKRLGLLGWLRTVALRKESVDRNKVSALRETVPRVALRKESVDRNMPSIGTFRSTHKSLSARRAWIEISMWCNAGKCLVCRSPQGERG